MRDRDQQQDFDLTVGRLDHCLSQLIAYLDWSLDAANTQTLKHHAEDMIGAGQKILDTLKEKGII